MSDFLLNRCLLIDDTMVDRYIHMKLLNHHKIARNVDECSGGKEALIYLEKAIVSDTLPDLILLDLMMPEMDGFELIRPYSNLLSKLVKKPLLFMLSSTEDERDIHRAKVNNHIIRLLRKPLRPEYLITLIKIQI
jgi:two-component system chemotaxis response regulator CheY